MSKLSDDHKRGKLQEQACWPAADKINNWKSSKLHINDELQSFLASINNHTNIDTIDLVELRDLLLDSDVKQMILDDSTKTTSQFLL